jgi:anti-sigma factor RsiW
MAKSPRLTDEDRENLVAYLDGELDAKTARVLEAKLNLDPKARQEAEGLRRAWELLDYLPKPEPSPTFSSKTLERISVFRPAVAASRVWRHWWQPWAYGVGWAASIMLASTVGFHTVDFFMRRARSPDPAANSQPVDLDQQLVRDLRVIENHRLYEHVDDIQFLRELDDPDLFGEDS